MHRLTKIQFCIITLETTKYHRKSAISKFISRSGEWLHWFRDPYYIQSRYMYL